jgi:hypothetical protein
MAKSFEQRNQSPAAQRKLKSLAKSTGVDVDFVTALANFTWDYNPGDGSEPLGWVTNGKPGAAAKEQLNWIAERIGLESDFVLTREQAAKDLIKQHAKQSPQTVWSRFLSAAAGKNYGPVSEFASHYYLRGLNKTNVVSLSWGRQSNVGMVEIARNLFLKFFRGGSIERDDLSYLWCDMTIPIAYSEGDSKPSGWLDQLLTSIEALPAKSGLKDLLGCCKDTVGGDKFFKQEVLQALAYADVLRVAGLPVTTMFLSDHCDELSPHFYSNEWTFPLRFWSTNGGGVNRGAIPAEVASN